MIRKILPCTALLTTVTVLAFSLVSCAGTSPPDPEETVTLEAPSASPMLGAWQALASRLSPEQMQAAEFSFDNPISFAGSPSLTLKATASADHCLKVRITSLEPHTTYYYRFFALGRSSPIGRTRTAPDGDEEHLTCGVGIRSRSRSKTSRRFSTTKAGGFFNLSLNP